MWCFLVDVANGLSYMLPIDSTVNWENRHVQLHCWNSFTNFLIPANFFVYIRSTGELPRGDKQPPNNQPMKRNLKSWWTVREWETQEALPSKSTTNDKQKWHLVKGGGGPGVAVGGSKQPLWNESGKENNFDLAFMARAVQRNFGFVT